MVLFILFPGHNLPSSKIWEMSMDDKMMKSKFIKELKKIGKVYKYVNNVYKVINLPIAPPKFREKATNLTLEQFDIDSECKKIYQDTKNIKDDIIVIGHSIGGLYANHFCKLYPKRVKKMILIESVKLIPKYEIIKIENKYKNLTEIKIRKLENNIFHHILQLAVYRWR